MSKKENKTQQSHFHKTQKKLRLLEKLEHEIEDFEGCLASYSNKESSQMGPIFL